MQSARKTLPEGKELLKSQQLYYAARATEYDDVFVPYQAAALPALLDRLRAGDLHGDVLELASGTGYWTTHLLAQCERVTAVDGSAEMIEQSRAKGLDAVDFRQADLFDWEPDRRWDGIFFAHWLAHVPPAAFADFWSMLDRALRPGGTVEFIDVTETERAIETVDPADPPIAVRRRLTDGREFRIVKVFFDPAELTRRLRSLAWECTAAEVAPGFLYATARRVA